MGVQDATPWGTGTAGTYYFFDDVIAAAGRANVAGVLTDPAEGANPLAVVPNTGLTVTVNSGEYRQALPATAGEGTGGFFSGGTITLAAADAVYPRIDYVSIWYDGSVDHLEVTTGVPDNSCPLPTVPIPTHRTPPYLNVVLAIVIMYPGMTEVLAEHIYDRRFFLPFKFTGSNNKLATAQIATWTYPYPGDGHLVTWNIDGNVVNSGRALTTVGTVMGPATASAASRLLGRGSASGAGDFEELTLGANLTMTGTTLAASGGSGAPVASAQGTYNTDSTERDLLSYTVPGGLLGTTGGVLWYVTARLLSNSGTNTWTLRVKLGATTLMGDVSPTLVNNANPRTITLWGMLFNNASASAQIATVEGAVSATTAGSVAGIMDIAAAGTATAALIAGGGVAAENTATDKVFAVTGQMAVSNVAVEFTWKAVAYLI